MKFIGIDLGWQSQPSGLCLLEWQNDRLQLRDLARLPDHEAVLDWIDRVAPLPEAAIVAVDAPTLIANATGMRLADRLAHRRFGRYHAGCYPANLSLPFAQRTVAFGQSLEQRGFAHAPTIEPQQAGRHQIEVFPHPAIVHLFQLDRILKYKKGRVGDRRAELLKLRTHMFATLPALEPSLAWDLSALPTLPAAQMADLTADLPQTGALLKALEDRLDSLICAYVAAHWWYWGLARNWVLGDESAAVCCKEGYIVVPAPIA